MYLKKLIAFFLLVSNVIFGQQTYQFSQYYFNKFLYNPGFAGFEDYVDIKSGFRNQWNGVNSTNKTFYLSANSAIGKKDYTSDGPTPNISNQKYYSFQKTRIRKNDVKPEAHQGIGLQLVSDEWGPVNTTSISFSYAYHIPLGGEHKMSAGFTIGNYSRTIDLSPGKFDVTDAGDELLNSDGKLSVSHNLINLGVTYYNRSRFIGISAIQPIIQTFIFTNNSEDTLTARSSLGQMPSVIVLQGGLTHELTENIKIYPSFLVKYIDKKQWIAEATFRAMYKESIWGGISYRYKESAGIHLGFKLSPSLLANYSYDFQGTWGPFTRSLSSNEITLAYMFYWKKTK